ncbi:MAG: DUF4097 domain-containing protein [Bacteroidales bacterium]
MKRFYRILILLIVAFVGLNTTVHSKDFTNYISVKKTVHKTFEDILEIHCDGNFFDVSIIGEETKTTDINGKIDGEFKSLLGKGNFDININFKKEKKTLKIWIDAPQNISMKNSIVKLKIITGKNCNVIVRNSSGNASVSNLNTYKIKVNTSSGDIDCNSLTSKSPMSIKSISGFIKAQNLSSKNVTIDSSSGDQNIESIQGDLNAKSISGSIIAKQIKGNATLKSSSGDLKVSEVSLNLTTNSISGNQVHSKIKENTNIESSSGDINLFHANNNVRVKSISGDIEIGDSEGKFYVRSTSAPIQCIGIKITEESSFNSVSGDILCRFRNTSKDLKFQLLSTSGDLEAGRTRKERKLYTNEGNILIKGNTTSGNQTYQFL